MNESALFWLSINFLSIFALAFYSMSEMACVSLNKARLHYYVQKGNHRAIWLNELLQNPSNLFGTTLIGVNVATVIGSECAREFYRAIGLSPDWSVFTQVILVVLLGELAPMFAARRFSEHVAMMCAPLVYASSILLTPILWTIGIFTRFFNWLVGGKEEGADPFLSQEELQKMLEKHLEEEHPIRSDSYDFNNITKNIFSLENQKAQDCMKSLDSMLLVPSDATVARIRQQIFSYSAQLILIYNKQKNNIVAITSPRNLLRAAPNKRARDYAASPWFVLASTPLLHILKQFKKNNEDIAIVINEQAQAVGVLSLDNIIERIFGEFPLDFNVKEYPPSQNSMIVVERSVPGNMTVREFKEHFNATLSDDMNITLSKLIIDKLGHRPTVGEILFFPPFEITIEEVSLLEIKKLSINSSVRSPSS